MKNYYELLEVGPEATTDQIHRAYEHAKRTYAEDSLASYSLFNAEDRRLILERVEDAYRVLMNESSRRQYNRQIDPSPSTDRQACLAPVAVRPPDEELEIPEILPGKELRRIREALGFRLEEIAGRTRIHQPYLEFIEADRHDKLPHRVYLRGYLCQYAQVLGLDPQRLSAAYMRSCPQEASEDA